MNKPIRVLQGFIANTKSGSTEYLLNNYRNINKHKVQIDFLTFEEKLDFEDEITSTGANIYKIPLFKKSPFLFIKELKKVSDNNNYDYFYINLSSAVPAIYVIIAKLLGFKNIIIHSHNTFIDSSNKVKRVLSSLLHYIFKPILILFPNYKFACSIKAGEWLFGKADVSSGKVKVLKNAINASTFRHNKETRDKLRSKLGLKGKYVIGHVGRFSYQKNHMFLIDVFNEVYKKNNNAVLLLIGKGELEKSIRNRIDELQLNDAVIFAGIRSDIPEVLQAMDIFILPSYFEGLPIVGVEAQAAGLPCIFSSTITKDSDITGLVEFIDLNKPIQFWSDEILRYANGYNRKDMFSSIVEAGYEINSTVEWLEDFYINNRPS
ncbi:glycosyltransferase [Bacillus salacetis]|uniref:glycosyltransferase n=1 Tax=Bacillus salacetis TaxID=2315464 RepID=UPI003BA0AC55